MANPSFIRQNLIQMTDDAKLLMDSFNASADKLARAYSAGITHIHRWANSNTTSPDRITIVRTSSSYPEKLSVDRANFVSKPLTTTPDDQLLFAFNSFESMYCLLAWRVCDYGAAQKIVLKNYNQHLHQWALLNTGLTASFSAPNFFLDTINLVCSVPVPSGAIPYRSKTLDEAQSRIPIMKDNLLELKTAAIVADYWITDLISAFNNHTHYYWPGFTTTPVTRI